MSSEARKIDLIEKVLKVKNEATLIELEAVLKKSEQPVENKYSSARDLSGVWSSEDAALIEKAIEEGCEQIDPNDWK